MDHSDPRPEPNDPRRHTDPEDPQPVPEAGVDDPGQGRPGPSRGPRPRDDVTQTPRNDDPAG
jgi:hypothetical protein